VLNDLSRLPVVCIMGSRERSLHNTTMKTNPTLSPDGTGGRVTFRNCHNLDILHEFATAFGKWFHEGSPEDRTHASIEQAIRTYLNAPFPVRIQIFHTDGRDITSEIPSEGDFIATRSLTNPTA
jgi:hypothetical protein